MKKTFHCPNCRAALRVEEAFEGRKIRCPRCKRELVIPSFHDEEPEVAPASETLLEQTDDLRIPQDTTLVNGGSVEADDDDFELDSSVETAPERFEPPKPSPDDPMLRVVPDFVPNPFQLSYPLDQNPDDADETDEPDEPWNNPKMPSVDELIN